MVTQVVKVESKTFVPETYRQQTEMENYFFLSLVALGFHCCARALSRCSECWLVFLAPLQWLLLWNTGSSAWNSVVAVRRLYLLHGMWNLPGPGIEPVSRALAGGFLPTVPPGKSGNYFKFETILKLNILGYYVNLTD